MSVGHNVVDPGSKSQRQVWTLTRKEASPALFRVSMCLVHIPAQQLPSAFPHPLPHFPPLIFLIPSIFFNHRGYHEALCEQGHTLEPGT